MEENGKEMEGGRLEDLSPGDALGDGGAGMGSSSSTSTSTGVRTKRVSIKISTCRSSSTALQMSSCVAGMATLFETHRSERYSRNLNGEYT